MPRNHRFPPVPKLHKPSGQARVRWQGKDRYLGKFGSPEADEAYQQFLREILNDKVLGGKTIPGDVLTVRQICDRWIPAGKEEYSGREKEYKQYLRVITCLCRVLGDLPAAEVGAKEFRQLREAMGKGSWLTDEERAEYKKQKWVIGWSRKVIGRRLSRARAIFRWGEEEKLLPRGFCAGLVLKPIPPKTSWCREQGDPTEPTDYADLLKVSKYCPYAVATMLHVQWWCGCRSGEIRIMRTCDLDRSGEVWVYRPEHHKNEHRGHDRSIMLGPQSQALLLPWLKTNRPQEYLFLTREGENRCYSGTDYPQAVRRACARAGVTIIPYGGRHAARVRVSRELSDEHARQFLGQRSIEATAHYGKVDHRGAAEAAKKCG